MDVGRDGGVLFKQLDSVYEFSPRGWRKYKVRETIEAAVGAISGSLAAPSSLLLGGYDDGRLQYTGRTTTLAKAASSTVAGLLAPALT